jgi:hypothetical protein
MQNDILKLSYDASGKLVSQTEGVVSVPQIIGKPVSQTVIVGESTSFSVVVSDAYGVIYRWKFNGTDIPGATGDSLLLTNVGAANIGNYSVEVKNSAGSVTSTPVDLKVS